MDLICVFPLLPYLILNKSGSGKFSDVFEAVDGGSSSGEIRESKVDVFGTNEMTEVDPDQLCVIKVRFTCLNLFQSYDFSVCNLNFEM